jgi:hypothetical protein
LEEVSLINPKIAKTYGGLSERTIKRDLEELIEMELMEYKDKKYKASTWLIMGHIAKQRN